MAECPTCHLVPMNAAEFARACGIARHALNRVEKLDPLTAEQRVNVTLAIAAVLGLETLFLEESARQQGRE